MEGDGIVARLAFKGRWGQLASQLSYYKKHSVSRVESL